MSARRRAIHHDEDRRVRRTREALLAAFRDLVLADGYDGVTVANVVERANVGRSTFYEHFESKADIFHQSLEPLLTILANAVAPDSDESRLVVVLEHFCDKQLGARRLLAGAAGEIAIALLTGLITDRLLPMDSASPRLPVKLSAAYIAGGQIALIRGWLDDVSACPAAALAAVLRKGSAYDARALRARL